MLRLLLAGAVLLSVAGGAQAAPSEFDLLDGYLAQYDVVAGLPHCRRMAGGSETAEMPVLPVDHVNGTNAYLDHHVAWHEQTMYLVGSPDFMADTNPYGTEFVEFHHHMVAGFDEWRAQHGGAPIPDWDPATPFPPELAYPQACRPRSADYQPVPLPGWLTAAGGGDADPLFGYHSLCEFPDLNRLGKATDFDGGQPVAFAQHMVMGGISYHSAVHQGVGGDLPQFQTSPRDPIFFAWHKFLDQRFQDWAIQCVGEPAQPTSEPSEQKVPSTAFGTILCAVALAALLRRR